MRALSLPVWSSFGHFKPLDNPSGFVDGPAVLLGCLLVSGPWLIDQKCSCGTRENSIEVGYVIGVFFF